MATLKLYLDSRATKPGNLSPLKAAITSKGVTTLISLGIKLLLSQWDDKARKVTNHPNKLFLNNYITRRALDIETQLLKLTESGSIGKMKPSEIRRYIVSEISIEGVKSAYEACKKHGMPVSSEISHYYDRYSFRLYDKKGKTIEFHVYIEGDKP